MSTVAARVLNEISHDNHILPTGRAILLALAIRTDQALLDPNGYSWIYESTLASDVRVSNSTVRKYLRHSALAVESGGGWRIAEALVVS